MNVVRPYSFTIIYHSYSLLYFAFVNNKIPSGTNSQVDTVQCQYRRSNRESNSVSTPTTFKGL